MNAVITPSMYALSYQPTEAAWMPKPPVPAVPKA